MANAYDETGAMGGLFAPYYNPSDPISVAAFRRWMAKNLKTPPATDPWFKEPLAGPSADVLGSDPASASRNAIAREMLLQGSGGGPSGDVGGAVGDVSSNEGTPSGPPGAPIGFAPSPDQTSTPSTPATSAHQAATAVDANVDQGPATPP